MRTSDSTPKISSGNFRSSGSERCATGSESKVDPVTIKGGYRTQSSDDPWSHGYRTIAQNEPSSALLDYSLVSRYSAPSCPSPFSNDRHRYHEAIELYGLHFAPIRRTSFGV